MIYEDTRQQEGKHAHIERWMRARGVDFAPRARALPFGDYWSDNGSNVAVDTKKDVQELAMDVGRDHARFVRECDRARGAGYRLVVLVESSEAYNDPLVLAGWVSGVCKRRKRPGGDEACRSCDPARDPCTAYRHKPMQGAALAKTLGGIERRHGARFEFVARPRAAERICELLGVEVG